MYAGGDEKMQINTINNVKDCRNRCLRESGCKYFSFRESRRGRKRCDLWKSLGFQIFSSRHAISGSVDGLCGVAGLTSMSKCQCDRVPKRGSSRYEICLKKHSGPENLKTSRQKNS